MKKQEIADTLRTIGKKNDGIDTEHTALTTARIHYDLLKDLEKQFQSNFQELTNVINDELNTLSDTLNQQTTELESLSANRENKVSISELKAQHKLIKQQVSQLKKDISNAKSEFSPVEKSIKAKVKALKSFIDQFKNREKQQAEEKKKIAEKRHNIDYINFPSTLNNNLHSQNKLISTNHNFKVFNTNQALADEITKALSANSFGSIIEEIAFLFGISGKRVLMLYKGGLKFDYNLEVNEHLRFLKGSYNKLNKTWWIPFPQLDRDTSENLRSYLSNVFDIVLDLDNLLIYTTNILKTQQYIHDRKSQPKVALISPAKILQRSDFDSQKTNHPALAEIFANDRGISIYNPLLNCFEQLRKTSTIHTKLPTLLIRVSRLNDYNYYILRLLDNTIQNNDHITDQRTSLYQYRTGFIGLNQDDYKHLI